MQIPEHIISLADIFVKKATGYSNRRKTKFLIADHVGFIESLGGKVVWPEAQVKSPPAEENKGLDHFDCENDKPD